LYVCCTQYHFLPGGPLHELKEELLLWASWRGQLLARTVRGLMSYRTALQAIARHENPHIMPPQQQEQLDALLEKTHRLQKQLDQLQQHQQQLGPGNQQQATTTRVANIQRLLDQHSQALQPLQQQQRYWEALRDVLLDDLVDSKYHLVVSSQNLGVFASKEQSGDNMKAAWLVHSIDTLRKKHNTLKVSLVQCPAALESCRNCPACSLSPWAGGSRRLLWCFLGNLRLFTVLCVAHRFCVRIG